MPYPILFIFSPPPPPLLSPSVQYQERDGISKRISSEESTLEQLRAKLHGVLQEAKVEQVALPLVGGGTLAGGGGGSSGGGREEKSRSRKRGRGDGDDEEEEEEEEESEEVGATIAGRVGLSLLLHGYAFFHAFFLSFI